MVELQRGSNIWLIPDEFDVSIYEIKKSIKKATDKIWCPLFLFLQYYKCHYCKICLPRTNYNYVDHSCFAHTDFAKQRIICNNLHEILIGKYYIK